MSVLQAIRAIAAGLWRTLRGLLLTLGVLAAVGLLGLGLALPLWVFSSLRPRLYTWFSLALLGAGIVYLLLRRIARRSREVGGLGAWARRRLVPAFRRIGVAVVLVAAAYAALVLFARGLLIVGAVVAVAVILLGGYLRFVRRSRSEGT